MIFIIPNKLCICFAVFRLTCVYLACKVDEFNVSIGQFVGNLKGDREKFANIILGFELLLMDKLHYHLTVHNPFRPLEGFFIDIKVCELRVCMFRDLGLYLNLLKLSFYLNFSLRIT